jgi:predicted RNA-binding protein with PIN domain
MNRELIRISDIESDIFNLEEIEGFIFIEEKQICFDGEKGFVTFRVVLQRESDNKYFEVTYTDFGKGQDDFKEQTAKEVFKKEITTYIYE